MTIYIKPKGRVLYLLSSVEVDLAAWIQAQGVTKGDVRVVIPVGEVIGSNTVDIYALNVGNIAPFNSVILDVRGEIQGRSGAGSESIGGDAVYSARALTINVSGAIRGGGGGGGIGGTGGAGNELSGSWTGYEYEEPYTGTNRTQFAMSTTGTASYWHNASKFISRFWDNYGFRDSYIYQRGSPRQGDYNNYPIRRATYNNGAPGIGGKGGSGIGYNQNVNTPENGALGTYSAGNGGLGGIGGNWGESGSIGNPGDTGLGYTVAAANISTPGEDGSGGFLGGYSIYTLDGPATGVIVNNTGTMNGRTYY